MSQTGKIMPLKLKCPNCGQAAVVPDTAINKRGRCISCHTAYAVRDAMQDSSQSISPRHVFTANAEMPRSEKIVMGFCVGIPIILLLGFVVYWFGIRDTWEIDNYAQIIKRCDAVLLAVRQSDYAALEAYVELNCFVGEHTIKRKSLTDRIEEANNAIAPINERIEQAQRERKAREVAEKRRRKAMARKTKRRRTRSRNSCTPFHDPSRSPAYMANYMSGHQTKSGAITSLANQFGESESWVRQNMGSSGSVENIHTNLVRQKFRDAGVRE